MADSRFKLEQVLVYRKELERLRKQDFATAKQAFEHASDELRRDEERLGGVSRDFCERQGELSSIEEMRMYADFFARKRDEIRQQRERIEHLGEVMDTRREELMDATKDKKVLESLKEKDAREFTERMSRKEQDFLDEVSIQKKKDPS